MTDDIPVAKQVKKHLRQLSALCDTGYLLAVHIRYTRPTLLFTTYPAVWLEHYGDKGLMLVDPVVRWAMSDTNAGGVALWADLANDDSGQVVSAAATHGLHNGMSFAIGPITSRTIGSVTSSTPFSAAATAAAQATITAIHDLTDNSERLDSDVIEALRRIG
jgi:LuxR family transcriptional regulator, quorum-sensing system regulator SdiA